MSQETEKSKVDVRESRKKQLNKNRVSLVKQRYSVLDYHDKDPNLHYYWVNDEYGKVASFIRAGWSIVEGDITDTFHSESKAKENQPNGQLWRVVNQLPGAKSNHAVLMSIPMELYLEDEKEKEDIAQQAIKRVDKDGQIQRAQASRNKF